MLCGGLAPKTACMCGRATVEVALLDVARTPEGRAHWSGKKQLRIITGMGNNSKDKEAVIKVCTGPLVFGGVHLLPSRVS